MVTFINAAGAVHTVSAQLFKDSYASCKKLSKAQLGKLGALADKVAELALIRLTAVGEDGTPDTKARSKAAISVQRAKADEAEFRRSLSAE